MRKHLFVIVLVLVVSASLWAVTATYESDDSFVWHDTQVTYKNLTLTFYVHLGTLTIDARNETIFNPGLYVISDTLSYAQVSGYDASGTKQWDQSANLSFVAWKDGTIIKTRNNYQGGAEVYQLSTGNGNDKGLYTIDFYIDLCWKPSGITKIIIDTNLGSNPVTIKYTDNNNAKINNKTDEGTVVNTTTGEDGSYNLISPTVTGSVAGEITTTITGQPAQLDLLFDITNVVESFSLENAVGTSAARVGTVTATVSGGSKSSYDLLLSFADENGSSDTFDLKHTEGENLIPYALRLGDDAIVKGTDYRWRGFAPDVTKSKELYVTGIDSAVAEASLAGTYKDTVTITAKVADTTL